MDINIDKEKLTSLRRELHRFPELSNYERDTAKRIKNFISSYQPDKIIEEIGGHGIAFIFKGKNPGPAVLFRSELDALPIEEENTFEYRSEYTSISHKCGHDGHATILAGLAAQFSKHRPEKGRVILMYQPAEETGEGAYRVVNSPKFNGIKPDYVFALHNLPGYDMGEIVVRDEVFSSASTGMTIKLKGKTSHAAEPEKGINPAWAVSQILQEWLRLYQRKDIFTDFVLLTIINVNLGEIAFGTSAGYAEIRATLRSYRNDDMKTLMHKAEEIATGIAKEQDLKIDISYTEEFLALVNDRKANRIIEKAAKDNGFKISRLEKPFRWSEDFSYFTNSYQGALFGLGSGKKQPQLHNPDFDFPDELIEKGIAMFYSIYKNIVK